MPVHVHKLTSKDLETMTGVCASCGPVRLRWRTGNAAGRPRTVRCEEAHKEARKRERARQKSTGWHDKIYNTPKAHGLTVLEARAYVVGKVCALCGSGDDLVVDHDHQTGKIRDALCRRHNLALGMMGDDPELLRAAAAYVQGHRE